MKKLLFFLLPIVFALIAFAVVTIILTQKDTGKGALQVTSAPQSNVYLNNKLLGTTPLCKCDGQELLPTGEYTIRIVPVDPTLSNQPFEQKITIAKSVLTVVDRTFGQGATSQGSIITLSPLTSGDNKTGALSVVSFPSGVTVSLDGNKLGAAPLTASQIIESDHDLLLSKEGYKNKAIRIHTVNGYVLSVIAFLGIDTTAFASDSAQVASTSAQPTKVKILTTPTGFLRVRDVASFGGTEIAEVKPGEEYTLVTEEGDWTEIKLSSGKIGWVSSSYVEKE